MANPTPPFNNNLKGPIGLPGQPGRQGIKGDTGPKGNQGPKGDKGDRGDKGDQGRPGTIGPKGDKGLDGGLTDPGSNGIVVRTALNTTVARTLQAGNSTIIITNGNGVAGDPTITGNYQAGSGISISGNIITSLAGGGTVTSVSGAGPIVITGTPTINPTVTIQGSIVSGAVITTAQNLGLLTTGLLKGTVTAGVSTLSTAAAGTDFADPLATYWVSSSSHIPTNGVNLGLLASGMLQHTVTAGVSVPSVFAAGTNRIPFGTTGGKFTDSADFTYASSNINFSAAGVQQFTKINNQLSVGTIDDNQVNLMTNGLTRIVINPTSGGTSGVPGSVRITSLTTNSLVKSDTNGTLLPAISGTDYAPAGNYITALTGDVTATGPGSVAATISSHAVTNAKFRQSGANKLVGNPTGSTADVTDIGLIAPIFFSGGNLILNYDASTLVLSGGTTLVRAALTGDITASVASNTTAFRSFSPLSVLGRSTSTSGLPADIAAFPNSNQVLRENGSGTIGWGFVALNSVTAPTGTGLAGVTSGAWNAAAIAIGAPLQVVTNTLGINFDSSLAVTGGTTLQRAALTGDVTASAGSNVTTISTHAVTYAKMQQVSAVSLLGNPTGSTANVSEITLGSGLSFSGTTLIATGSGGTVTNVTASNPLFSSGGTTPNITIQGSIVSGDTSTTAQNLGSLTTGILFGTVTTGVNTISTLTIGSGLSLTGSTLSATSAGGSVTVVTGTAPIFITSTPTTTPNVTIQGSIVSGSTATSAQNLGALNNGTLQQTISAGVATVSAFNGAAGSVPFYVSSGQLDQNNGNFFWDSTNSGLRIGGATLAGTNNRLMLTYANTASTVSATNALAIFNDTDPSGQTILAFENNTSIVSGIRAAFDGSLNFQAAGGQTFQFYGSLTTASHFGSIGGTGFYAGTGAGTLASHGAFETDGSLSTTALYMGLAGTEFIKKHGGQLIIETDDVNNITLATNGSTALTITSGQAIQVPSLNAGGMVKATVTSGQLGIAVAGTDYQAPITWPTLNQILISNGTSSVPIGSANLTFSSGNLIIGTDVQTGTVTASSLVATDSGQFLTAVTVDAPLSYSAGHLSLDLSQVPTASYKFSMSASSSGGILNDHQTVIVAADSGSIPTGAGFYTAAAGIATTTTLAANYATNGGPTAYGLMRAYTKVKFQVYQNYIQMSVANGTTLTYVLYSTNTPTGGGALYTVLASWNTGPMNLGTSSGITSGIITNTISVSPGTLIMLVVFRTDTTSAVLATTQFTATVDFFG